MLRKCHGHGLTKGAIIQIFYHGLNEQTQGILDITARGIILYKSSNQAFQFLDDKVLFKLDWSLESKIEHHQRYVAFADGSNSDVDNSRLLEKLEALTIKLDSQFQSLKEEMHETRKNYNNREGDHASKNDDTPMCERHKVNYIQSEGYLNRNSHDSHSHKSHHDHNNSKKSLTKSNNDVRNDLEDFKRCSKMSDVNINTLTMEQYLALTRGNQAPGVVKPANGNNFNFEIKSAPTMADIHIIKETLDDMMREGCKTAEEYVYHTEQTTIYLNNRIVWGNREEELIPQVLEKEALVFYDLSRNPNEPPMFLWNKDLFYMNNGNTKAKKHVLSMHKIHATPFTEDDLQELLTIWVGKVFKRVKNKQGYRQDFMDKIVVKWVDGKAYILAESDYKSGDGYRGRGTRRNLVEEPKPLAGDGDQFDAHPNPQLGNMNGWVDDNDDVKEEDEENEDADIKEDDDAEIIFPYEVQGDQTPPPRDESSFSDSEPEAEEADDEPEADEANDELEVEEAGVEPEAEGADVELEAEEPDGVPEATIKTGSQRPFAVRDFPVGFHEAGESSTARDPQFVGGFVPWALRRDLEALHRHERIREAESETSRTEVALIMPPKPMSEARMHEIIRDQFAISMNEFMENMNNGAGGSRGASGSGGAGGSGGTGGNADGTGVRAARPTVPKLTECTYATFIKCDPLPFNGTEGVNRCSKSASAKKKDRVKFTMATLRGRALTWWNGRTKAMGIEAANNTPSSEARIWMTEEFCPQSVIQRMEQELYNLRMKGMDIDGYTNRFHELALLCPRMVEPEAVKMEQYLRGQLIQDKDDEATEGEKRKGESDRGGRGGDCWKCTKCGKLGHKTERCQTSEMSCYNCTEKGHRKRDCPKLGRNRQGGNNRGGPYQLGAVNTQEDSKVVTGTFLLNNHFATALFDSGADRSFVSTKFSTLINSKPVEIDTSYEVELVDGKIVSTNNVLKVCSLNLLNHSFPIDLMVIELGSFDVVIGMDWLSKNDAAILCGEKNV
nr:hypothetical protein [Tanacetum cinerariifolium]